MVLHGVYDHGKIEIKGNDLPQIRALVKIILPETDERLSDGREKALSFLRNYSGRVAPWTREELHER